MKNVNNEARNSEILLDFVWIFDKLFEVDSRWFLCDPEVLVYIF